MTTVRTPFTTFVRSVTVNTTLRLTRSPSSVACPSQVNRVPGTSGNHGFVTSVGWVKFAGSKSAALTTGGRLWAAEGL